jgi:glycosyltransferase involved in cell wall biosynthesis
VKLLIDGDVFCWQRYGGITRVYEQILPRLARNVPDLEITMVLRRPPVSKALEGMHLRTECVPKVPAMRPWQVWHPVTDLVDTVLDRHYWRSRKADVFHTTYYTAPCVRAPSVCIVYDLLHEEFADSFDPAVARETTARKRAAVEQSRIVVCISQATKEGAVRWLGVDPGKCRVVPLAGLPAVGAVAALPGCISKPFVLYVGNYSPAYKNFAFLLRALASAPSARGLELVVAGVRQPPEHERLSYNAMAGGTQLHFVAGVSDSILRALYGSCEAMVLPSLNEGFGLPVLEALGEGAPVVCSAIDVMREVGGEAVQIFDPRSIESFGVALAIARSEGRKPEAVHRRRLQASRFSWDRTTEGLWAAFREAAE